LPYIANIGARFLIPPAPFLCLALALACAGLDWVLLALIVAHAITCWPSIARLYCAPSAWRLAEVPVKAALRIEPETGFLRRHTTQYDEARLIDQIVPPGGKVFSFSQIAEAYTSREVLVSYQSAPNEVMRDMLLTALFKDYQPRRILTFRFTDRDLRAIRVVQTAQARDTMWGIGELRVFSGGTELARAPGWRLRASPNPWDVQLAFDNNPATRWRSWQTAEPGMFVQVDFGRAQHLDSVVVESADEGHQTRITLDGLDSQGNWSTLVPQPSETMRREPMDLRRLATLELKARGVRYVMVGPGDIHPEDFQLYPRLWGLKLAGRAGDTRLYLIE